MYDLLQVSWFRSGAPAVRYTICCRCLGLEVVPQHEDGLEVVPQHEDVRFVAGVLVSKWSPSTEMNVLVSELCPSIKI